jgi:hypothetical protein
MGGGGGGDEAGGAVYIDKCHNTIDGDGVRRDIGKGTKYLQLAAHGGMYVM